METLLVFSPVHSEELVQMGEGLQKDNSSTGLDCSFTELLD